MSASQDTLLAPPESPVRLRYESWHLLHLYVYLGVGLALPHQLWTGKDFLTSPVATLYRHHLWGHGDQRRISAVVAVRDRSGPPVSRWNSYGLAPRRVAIAEKRTRI